MKHTLTLTPSRFAAATAFTSGSFAIVLAPRSIRKLGVLIQENPLIVLAQAGSIAVSLEPSTGGDEGEAIMYMVTAFDGQGSVIFRYDVLMPDTDANLFDLIPMEQDKDSCVVTTLSDNSG